MAPLPSPADHPPEADELSPEALRDLLQALRRKEGTWAEWGTACQQLQKSGYSPQQIFEETGFEPIQQNQIIVAAQVYQSIATAETPPEVLTRFERTGSDTLYELRILSQSQRIAAAQLIVERGIDSVGAKDVAKALKEFSRLSNPPREFAEQASDAVAYHYWNLARQQADLQSRSRLIASALRFASSDAARRQVESLLTDFTVSRNRPAPRLPFYRLESAEDQPHILPVVGRLPLSLEDFKAVPLIAPEGVFQMVRFSGTGAYVALPGWQVVRSAEDPVMLLTSSDHLPGEALTDPTLNIGEDVLIMVDRAQREWDANSYFMVAADSQIQMDWFADAPTAALLGRVVLVLRPPRILDEDFNRDLWQLEE